MRFAFLTLLAFVLAAGAADGADPIDYRKDVRPVLQARCYACHGALAQKAKLRVDSSGGMLKAGVVVPGKPGESPLVERVSSADDSMRMPPEGHPLKADEIARIRDWIAQGAKVPADDAPEADPRDHWSFHAPVRPQPPVIESMVTVNGQPFVIRNPIDAFAASVWREKNLRPVAPADRRLLLRRVYLDLTGLPPTPADIEAFLADTSPEAYERVVDRLLASPEYGERWGRHFLDVWRYSDWWGLGAELRNSQRHIWHWRDWVVESLNSDLGYDEMIRQMLAADELYPTDPQKLRATGYLARSYFLFNRTTWLDEVVEHTGKAFLGLTFNCAKCHDHKYDPIRQLDFYRFRAVFEPYQVRTDLVPGEPDVMKDGIPRAFDCNLDARTPFHVRGDERNPDPSRLVLPGLPQFLAPDGLKIEPIKLPALAYRPGARPELVEAYRRAAEAKVAVARQSLAQARARLVEIRTTSPVPQATVRGKVIVADDFAQADPDKWELGPGMWRYESKRLVQANPGAARSFVRARTLPPGDFEATAGFVITGGDPYKSVGIAFDVGEGNEILVYVSAHKAGNKVQVAYKKGPDYVYPPEGALAATIPVNKPQTLAIRARGPLINVSLNGEFALAYTLPIPRKAGKLDLITYTATAKFAQFELRELPTTISLTQPGAKPSATVPLTPELAWARTQAAERALMAAEAEYAAIEARARADASGSPEDGRRAARAEKLQAVLTAERDLALAEADVLFTAPAARPSAETKRKAAADVLTAAKQSAATSGSAYTPLPGAVKSAESNLETAASRARPFPDASTGRRTALANWLAAPSNPLTARVAVNHVWLRHFGRPLVPNVFEFGRKGSPPSHPELVDWLAVELMEHKWSLKHLHRLIVTSSVYRMSSAATGAEADQTTDPENRCLWRMNPLRMEAETVRDSLLSLAGDLDITRGGPPVPLAQQETSRRRALYFFHSHNEHDRLLDVFDNANVLECYRRTESIVPQQALALWNSRLALSAAGKINDALHARLGDVDDRRFVVAAFAIILGAEPSAAELKTCLESLAELRTALRDMKEPDRSKRARLQLVQALVNHNDFVAVR